jgi:dipeptidyl aminopeptidase/acylaminoacyl peptidase
MMGKPPLSAEDFHSIDTLSDPQVSPDDRWVAFVRQSVDRQENVYRRAIWLASVDGASPKPFTSGTHRDDSPRWSPDGRHVAFLSDRAGGEPQLYLIPIDGGEASQLTRMPDGVTSLAWSPDGTRIAFVSSVDAGERSWEDCGEEPPIDPTEHKLWKERRKQEREKREDPRLITRFPYREGTSYLGDRYPHIYVIDVPQNLASRDEVKPRRLTGEDRMYGPPVWTTDGTAVLVSVNRDPEGASLHFPSDILRIPIDGGETRVIVGGEGSGHHTDPKPSPDGRWIAYLTHPEEHYAAQNAQVALVPADGGEPRVIIASLDANVVSYCWARDSQSVYLMFGDWGNAGVHRVTLDGEATQLVEGERVVLGFDVGEKTLAYAVTAPDIPADLYLADADGGNERRCTEINAELLAERWLSMPQEVRYTRPDGIQIQGWVMHPPGFDREAQYPLALEIHGGPHDMWGNTFWHEFQVIAGRGYVVFFCNPRGSDGYGQDFRDAIHARWGEADADDILTGVNGLIKQGYIDEQRLVITGGSYGGYMTTWIIGHDKRFAAAVSQRGVQELVGFYGVTDIPLFLEAEFDVPPWEDVETLWRYSPLAYVEQIETPLLILHSDLDFRVPVSSGEQLYAALKRLKREVALLRYPREGHELSRSGEPAHRVDRINRIVGWFDRYTMNGGGMTSDGGPTTES